MSEPNKKLDKTTVIAILSVVALAVALIAFGFTVMSGQKNTKPSTAQPETQAVTLTSSSDEDICVHDWTITYKNVHHDAVTHTETVNPVYANKTEYHTVCNECQQVIDGIADQHIKDTGHSGYSTNVPITKEVLVSEGYTQEITDQAAYDETVADKMVCTKCGAEKPVSTEAETE